MDYLTNSLFFNPEVANIAHLDINSCFATCEQQANPFLRNKPLVVVAFDSNNAVILASSIEAKRLGIKTGMRICDARKIYPKLINKVPDPEKYRNIHHAISKILDNYSSVIVPKSIDEFVIDFNHSPYKNKDLIPVCNQIKSQIKNEVGEWVSVSIGLGPNRFLAKVASNIKKPDGLELVNKNNYLSVYSNLKLRDLHGVNIATSNLLNCHNIYTVLDFYNTSIDKLKTVFKSVHSLYWYLRLHGYEVDDYSSPRQSMGNMHALKLPTNNISKIKIILYKLVLNTSNNIRLSNLSTSRLSLVLVFNDSTVWQKSHKLNKSLFDTYDIYQESLFLLNSCPYLKFVKNIAFTCSGLEKSNSLQLEFFSQNIKKSNLNKAIDKINLRYGIFSIVPAGVLDDTNLITDSIGFGKIK